MTAAPNHRSAYNAGSRTPLRLDGDTAIDLLIANSGPGQTVLDLDDDPVLRAATLTTGRHYRTRRSSTMTRAEKADLVTLAWPRPHAPHPAAGVKAFAYAASSVAPGGCIALLLDPTTPQAYTVTWTGAVLAAARSAGMDYLQDVVCLHTVADPEEDVDHGGDRTEHRVVLILRAPGSRLG